MLKNTKTARRIAPVLAAAITSLALCSPSMAQSTCAGADVQPTASNAAQIASTTLCLLNQQRAAHGLPSLHANSPLASAARPFSARLVREHFFDHTAPDGVTMLDRIKKTSYLHGTPRRWWAGENLGYGSGALSTPAEIVDAWMHSAGHRANILDGHFTAIGFGITLGTPSRPDGATYVTDFGGRIG